MATVTKTIGTAGRDYSTITAWEADLDDTGIYTSGDDAVGECYNDSAFDESVTINGGSTVGLGSVTLSVAAGERHDGTVGTGARLVQSSTKSVSLASASTRLEWLEFDGGGFLYANVLASSTNLNITFANLIVHNATKNAGSSRLTGIALGVNQSDVTNCIIYNLNQSISAAVDAVGISAISGSGGLNIQNNTLFDITKDNGAGRAVGIQTTDVAGRLVQNNIVSNVSGTGSGTHECFDLTTVSSATYSHNLSSDATASGTGSLTGKSATNQFVSIVGGSEDLHLKTGADAIGAGTDLGATPTDVNIDINGSNRNALAATVWDIGAHQYASTASIGTSSRDYSTITLWEADLDDTTIYGAGANAVGECYNDTTFNESPIINGGSTVGLNSVKLSVATSDRHDGTAGTGARIERAAFAIVALNSDCTIEWIEVKQTKTNGSSCFHVGSPNSKIKNCIGHTSSIYGTGDGGLVICTSSANDNYKIINNILYNGTLSGIKPKGAETGVIIIGNTVFNCVYNGIIIINTSQVQNNISINNSVDFPYSGTSAIQSNNLSSDSTASGTGSKTNQPASRQFVSTLSGSEDLHLIFKSAAIDAGVDLGTTPDGVQYDINGKDRDAENSIWDIGAHEYGDNVIFGLLKVRG